MYPRNLEIVFHEADSLEKEDIYRSGIDPDPVSNIYPTAPVTNIDLFKSQQGKVATFIIKCGMKLLIHSQNSTIQPLKYCDVISAHTLFQMWLYIHVENKVNPC